MEKKIAYTITWTENGKLRSQAYFDYRQARASAAQLRDAECTVFMDVHTFYARSE